jgi:hypothetical protein
MAKNNDMLLLGAALLVILFVANGGAMPFASVYGGTCTAEGAAKPLFGYFKCEPSGMIYNPIGLGGTTWVGYSGLFNAFNENKVIISCPNVQATTDACNVQITKTSAGLLEDVSGYTVKWSVCSAANANSCAATSVFNINTGSGVHTINSYPMKTDEVMVIQITSPRLLKPPTELFVINEVHQKFVLNEYVSGGLFHKNVADCSNIPQPSDGLVTAIQKTVEGLGILQGQPIVALKAYESSNFLDDYVVSATGKNIVNHPTYGRAFCLAGTLYGIETHATMDGRCYDFPTDSIGQAACCPNEIQAGSNGAVRCTDSFTWSTAGGLGTDSCGVPASTMNCVGVGIWTSSGSNQVKKAIGCDSNNKCVYQTAAVACTPPSNGCSAGATCTGDINNPSTLHCESGCSAGYDRDKNCYDDCTQQVVANCIPPPPVCNEWDIWCKINAWITGTLQTIGLMAIIIVILAAVFLSMGGGALIAGGMAGRR